MKRITALIVILAALPLAFAVTGISEDGNFKIEISEESQSCGGIFACEFKANITAQSDACLPKDPFEAKTAFIYDSDQKKAVIEKPSWYESKVVDETAPVFIPTQIDEKNGTIKTVYSEAYRVTTGKKITKVPLDLYGACLSKGERKEVILPVSKAASDTVKMRGTFLGVEFDPFFLPANAVTYATLVGNWSTTRQNPFLIQGYWDNGTFENASQTCAGISFPTQVSQCWQVLDSGGTRASLDNAGGNISIAPGTSTDLVTAIFADKNGHYYWNGTATGYPLFGSGNGVNVSFFVGAAKICTQQFKGNLNATNYECDLGSMVTGTKILAHWQRNGDISYDYLNITGTIYVSSTNDTTAPKYLNSTMVLNETLVSKPSNFSITWTDNIALADYLFAFDNGNGTFYNQSGIFPEINNSAANIIRVLNSSPSAIVRWYWWAEDSNGNGNTTPVYSLRTVEPARLTLELYDEKSAISINGTLVLANGTNSTSYAIANSSFVRLAYPTGNLTITASAPGYYSRQISETNNASNSSNQTIRVYLINTTDGSDNYFKTVAASGSVPNAVVTFYLGGTQIASYTTDGLGNTGAVMLSPFSTYSLLATASGYGSYSQTISGSCCRSSANPQLIPLGGSSNNTVGFFDPSSNTTVNFTPSGGVIFTRPSNTALQSRTFNLDITTYGIPFTAWGVNYTLGNGTLLTTSYSTAAYGGSVSKTINMTSQEAAGYLTAKVWWLRNGTVVNVTYRFPFITTQQSGTGIGGLITGLCGNPNDKLFLGILVLGAVIAVDSVAPSLIVGAALSFGVLVIGVTACVIPWYQAILAGLASLAIYMRRGLLR